MHTHHFTSGFNPSKEHRLCHLSPGPENVREQLQSPRQIRENPALTSAMSLYLNPVNVREYPGLQSTTDQAYFQSLMLAGMLTGNMENATYRNANRGNIRVLDPMRLDVAPPARTDEQLGQLLMLMYGEDQIDQLFAGLPANGEANRAADLGQRYRDILRRGNEQMNKRVQDLHYRPFQLTDPEFGSLIRMPIMRYLRVRDRLNELLRNNSVLVAGGSPDAPPGNLPAANRDMLGRSEYLGLLAILFRDPENGEKQVNAALGAATLDARFKQLRALVNGNVEAQRVRAAFAQISMEIMGPTETMREWGVTTGPALRKRYVEARRGRPRPPIVDRRLGTNHNRYRYNANLPNLNAQVNSDRFDFALPLDRNIPENQLINRIDAAATWRDRPELALAFLRGTPGNPGMPETAENRRFLDSLSHYIGTNWAPRPAGRADLLTPEDTRAVLSVIIDQLTDTEQIEERSSGEREDLRTQVGITQTINNVGREMIDMVRNWRENPVGAALVIGGAWFAFQAIRDLYNSEDIPRFVRWGVYGALGGLLVHMVQEHRTGRGWLDEAWKTTMNWARGESDRPPEQQTLPAYWRNELGAAEISQRYLSLLHDQEVPVVMSFYNDMLTWERNGRNPQQQPQLPQSFNGGRYRRMFGTMTQKEIGMGLFETLRAFFRNRGEHITRQGIDYPGMNPGAEERGAAYVDDRYGQRRFFTRIVEGTVIINGVRIQGVNAQDMFLATPAWQAELKRVQSINQMAYQQLVALRTAYVEERRNPNSARPWQWWSVLLFEADEGRLRAYGRNAVQPANMLDRVYRTGRDYTVDANWWPLREAEPDRALNTRLFTLATGEYSLISTGLGNNRYAQNYATRLDALPAGVFSKNVSEGIRRDWRDFADRLPVTASARQDLRNIIDPYIASRQARTLGDVLNELERMKYQLLIAATRDANRLSTNITNHLHAGYDDANWISVTSWVPFSGTDRFPRIRRFTDLSQLFNGSVRFNTPLAEDINRHSATLEIMRLAPTAPMTAEGVDGLEELLAQRFANRVIEAHLLNHAGNTGDTVNVMTPDAQARRRITDIEQSNLRLYLNSICEQLLPEGVIKNFQTIEKLATELERLGQAYNIQVVYRIGGQMTICMNTGARLTRTSERFLSQEQIDKFVTARRFISPMNTITTQQFEKQGAAATFEAWRTDAIAQLNAGMPGFNFQLQAGSNTVEWGPAVRRARNPLPDVMRKTHKELRDIYERWRGMQDATRPPNPVL